MFSFSFDLRHTHLMALNNEKREKKEQTKHKMHHKKRRKEWINANMTGVARARLAQMHSIVAISDELVAGAREKSHLCHRAMCPLAHTHHRPADSTHLNCNENVQHLRQLLGLALADDCDLWSFREEKKQKRNNQLNLKVNFQNKL